MGINPLLNPPSGASDETDKMDICQETAQEYLKSCARTHHNPTYDIGSTIKIEDATYRDTAQDYLRSCGRASSAPSWSNISSVKSEHAYHHRDTAPPTYTQPRSSSLFSLLSNNSSSPTSSTSPTFSSASQPLHHKPHQPKSHPAPHRRSNLAYTPEEVHFNQYHREDVGLPWRKVESAFKDRFPLRKDSEDLTQGLQCRFYRLQRFPVFVFRPSGSDGEGRGAPCGEEGEGEGGVEVLRDAKGKPVMRQLTVRQRSHIEVPVLDPRTGQPVYMYLSKGRSRASAS
jgi:hypothetical protein